MEFGFFCGKHETSYSLIVDMSPFSLSVVSMTLRYLLSTAEHKDLQEQFGVAVSTYIDAVQHGIKALVKLLFNHKKGGVSGINQLKIYTKLQEELLHFLASQMWLP